MADLHRRAASSAPRLTPEEVSNRGFATAFRGVSETDVRNFLKRVSDEMAVARDHEAELVAQVEELEERLRHPAPVTERQLLDSLGEETARVLRSAQEAAEDIRSKAEERSATLVREAQEEASRLREEAQREAEGRTERAEAEAAAREQAAAEAADQLRADADRVAAETRETAEREANESRRAAERENEEALERVRVAGGDMLAEAKAVRERILTDLARRRGLLQTQIDELRAGRDRLLDAYRVVKRTLGEATNALQQLETRAAAELASGEPIELPPVEGVDLSSISSSTSGSSPSGVEGEAEVEVEGAGDAPPKVDLTREERLQPEEGPDLDALFARLRADREVVLEPGPEPQPEGATPSASTTEGNGSNATPPPLDESLQANKGMVEGVVEGVVEESVTIVVDEPVVDEPVVAEVMDEIVVTEVESKPESDAAGEEPEPASADDLLRAERDEALRPVRKDLVRKGKRRLQDDQNELLDRLRQQGRHLDPDEVVLPIGTVIDGWVDALTRPLERAYQTAYRAHGEGTPPRFEVAAVEKVARELMTPVHERVASVVAGAAGAGDEDREEIGQRIGARYRELRGQELEPALDDALAGAWARGVYDALPKGTVLRWVAAEEGRCPDCDDNALEPTVKGESFPTGQMRPPAHPGCRCLLAPAHDRAAVHS